MGFGISSSKGLRYTFLHPQYTIDVHGGSIWCMAADPDGKFLAIGCEDGCVRLYSVLPSSSSLSADSDDEEAPVTMRKSSILDQKLE
jgi:WD40 repeat protein